MANGLNANIWTLDTVDAGVVIAGHVRVARVRWVSKGASAGDDAVLKDAAGNIVFESVATGANYVEESPCPFECAGIAVPTLDSGTIFLYLDLSNYPNAASH